MKTKWKLITNYPIKKYACGLVAGQKLRLRKDLTIKNTRGESTGPILRAGEIWEVLPGSAEPPIVVWLRQPDGERHTWDDSQAIFETFEIIGPKNRTSKTSSRSAHRPPKKRPRPRRRKRAMT